MSITIEVISQKNAVIFEPIIDSIYHPILHAEDHLSLGMKQNGESIGAIVARLEKDKAIVLFLRAIREPKDMLLLALLQATEQLLKKKNIAQLFFFYAFTDKLEELFSKANWQLEDSQIHFQIDAKPVTKRLLPIDVQMFPCTYRIYEEKLAHLQLLDHFLPPFEVIDPNRSSVLMKEKEIVGWLIVLKTSSSAVLNISRFYIQHEFRELKTSIPFVRNALYQAFQHQPFDIIEMSILASNEKLINVIDRGFVGQIKTKQIVRRAHKIF